MANAQKLPSGSWRTQASKVINGKKVVKSFTVHPRDCGGDNKKAKKMSEHLASEWQLSHEESKANGLNVHDAIQAYINDRINILSPATIRGYRLILASFEPMWNIYISDIDTPMIQRYINDWSMELKTKTIKNRVTLLLSALDYHKINTKFKVKYKENNSEKVDSPDIEDVKMLIENANDTMKAIIMLAAFGTLRRGEIAGLKQKDISRDMRTVHVHADMVLDENNKWVYKPFPKTKDSTRVINLPKFVIDFLPVSDNPDAFLFDLTPTAMTDRFRRLADKLQLDFTLHSLRHYSATFRTDLGIPKKYVQEVGGWVEGNNAVFDKVYDDTIESSRRKYTRIANKFIEDNFQELFKKSV